MRETGFCMWCHLPFPREGVLGETCNRNVSTFGYIDCAARVVRAADNPPVVQVAGNTSKGIISQATNSTHAGQQTDKPNIKTPNCDKLAASSGLNDYTVIVDFLDWCSSRGVILAQASEHGLVPLAENRRDTVYAHLGVDSTELEKERRALLDEQRQFNTQRKQTFCNLAQGAKHRNT